MLEFLNEIRPDIFEGSEMPVIHVDFTEPYTPALRQRLLGAAAACGEAVIDGGVYACTQGPRLETAAEIERIARDGGDMVGMTGMPEAVQLASSVSCVLAMMIAPAALRLRVTVAS